MISLEEEITKITKGIVGEEITEEDVMRFFEQENRHIQRLIDIKQLSLTNAQDKYNTLGYNLPKEKNTPLSLILADLAASLKVAQLAFEDDKIVKSCYIIKRLKVAIASRQHDVMNDCLLDLQTIRESTKDYTILYLEEQLAKFSRYAQEEGKVYLDFFTQQEQRENLLSEIIELKYQLMALNNLI